jgi:hypothetical protein
MPMRSGLFLPLFDELADPAIIARLSAEAEQAGRLLTRIAGRSARGLHPGRAIPKPRGIGVPQLPEQVKHIKLSR